MAGALTAGAAATGVRAYLLARLGRRTRRVLTGVLVTGGVLAAGVLGPTP